MALPEIKTEMTADKCRENARACRRRMLSHTDPDDRRKLENLARAWEDLCTELEAQARPRR